jgi:hypothetical protein
MIGSVSLILQGLILRGLVEIVADKRGIIYHSALSSGLMMTPESSTAG